MNIKCTLPLFLLVVVAAVVTADPEAKLCTNACSDGCKTYAQLGCIALQGEMFEDPFMAIKFVTYKSDPTQWTVATFNSSTTCDASTVIMSYPIKCSANTCCNTNLNLDSGEIMTSFVVFTDASPTSSPIAPAGDNNNNGLKIGIGVACGLVGLTLIVVVILVIRRRRRANYSTM